MVQRPERYALLHYMFFNDTATTEIYTLSLHDALPIYGRRLLRPQQRSPPGLRGGARAGPGGHRGARLPTGRRRPLPAHGERSEEHTSELQSRQYLVCRLLLEKKTPVTPIFRMPSSA